MKIILNFKRIVNQGINFFLSIWVIGSAFNPVIPSWLSKLNLFAGGCLLILSIVSAVISVKKERIFEMSPQELLGLLKHINKVNPELLQEQKNDL